MRRTPQPPTTDAVNDHAANAVLSRQSANDTPPAGRGPDSCDLLERELMPPVLNPSPYPVRLGDRPVSFAARGGQWRIATPLPPLGVTVCHVVLMGAEEQVARSHTLSIIAAMQDVEPIQYGAVGQRPGDTMSPVDLMVIGEHRVAVDLEQGRSPLPAPIGLRDLAPKALFKRHSRHGCILTRDTVVRM